MASAHELRLLQVLGKRHRLVDVVGQGVVLLKSKLLSRLLLDLTMVPHDVVGLDVEEIDLDVHGQLAVVFVVLLKCKFTCYCTAVGTRECDVKNMRETCISL